MRYLLLLFMMFIGTACLAQNISGTVIDKSTKLPVSGAVVSAGGVKVYTSAAGKFELTETVLSDSLRVTHFAYKTYVIPVDRSLTAIHIELEPRVIPLNEVTIHGERNYKKDSIDNRIAFAKQFNYTGPKVIDAFKNDNPYRGYGELVSVNLLLLVEALTKKSTPEYKFNKLLVRDEQTTYIDTKFNRTIASQITGLKGDTLKEFMSRYFPTYQFAKKATDYDMQVYIKQSFEKFKKEGMSGVSPFTKP